MKIKDEDKQILLVVSLSYSYRHFKGILLCSNNDTSSFEDKVYFIVQRKFDCEVRAEKGEDLFVRGESFDKRNTNKSKMETHKSNKFYKYYKKRWHLVDNCYILKRKKEKDERNKQPQKSVETSIVESDSDGDVLFATSTKRECFSLDS